MLIKKIVILIFLLSIFSCAEYKQTQNIKEKIEPTKYSTSGFVLIYEDSLFKEKIINRKIRKNQDYVLHKSLKVNTNLLLYNPKNSKKYFAKVKKAKFPDIYSLVITNNMANYLELDMSNPFIEIYEVKDNLKFVAKKATTFDEEKKVAEKVPVNTVSINNISENQNVSINSNKDYFNYSILISDFYFLDSANKLKEKLTENSDIKKLYIKNVKPQVFRLASGPFKDFITLKNVYLSLNRIGFDELKIFKNDK